MPRVTQEFYCNDCQGYFRAKLNMAINMKVLVCCPNCCRQHPRWIENGEIKDNYSRTMSGNPTDEIIIPMSAYSKKPKFETKPYTRDGNVIETKARDPFLRSLWEGIFG